MPDGGARSDVVLVNVDERFQLSSGSFNVPPLEDRESLWPGDLVKVVVVSVGGAVTGERIWVRVLPMEMGRDDYWGEVVSFPVADCLRPGDVLAFGPEHVADVYKSSRVSERDLN